MRRDHQWRANLRNEMRSTMAGDPDYTAHRVVGRVVHGVPVESLTAATSEKTVYHPTDHNAPIRDTVAHFHATLLRFNMAAARGDDKDCDCEDPP